MTEEMACFRLDNVKLEWTKKLDQLFIKSKQAIIDQIIQRVHMFDPTLNTITCLATDFSLTGLDFRLPT